MQENTVTGPRRRPALMMAAAAVTALALTLGACSADEEPVPEAGTGDTGQAQDQSIATGSGSGTADDAALGDSAPEGDPGDATDAPVEPAEPRTIEIDETMSFSDDDQAFTVTVHRVVVNDYYVETELTIVNDGTRRLDTWFGGQTFQAPRLYDDRGRTYTFQVQPGGEGDTLRLEAGEGVDAVVVFAGRLDPQAQQLTFDLSELGASWSQMTFQAPIEGSR